jgi:hypothetical protein
MWKVAENALQNVFHCCISASLYPLTIVVAMRLLGSTSQKWILSLTIKVNNTMIGDIGHSHLIEFICPSHMLKLNRCTHMRIFCGVTTHRHTL